MSYKIYLTLIGLIMALLTSNCKTSMEKADSCDIVTGVCKPANLENLSIKNKEVSNEEKSDMKLIYYFDALCGWCYGFSPVMSKVQEKYSGKLDIEVVSGGLFLGKRAGGVNEVAPHIKAGAYKSVERRTGGQIWANIFRGCFEKWEYDLKFSSSDHSLEYCKREIFRQAT